MCDGASPTGLFRWEAAVSSDVTASTGTTTRARGNISRWSIEHPYIVIAFYLGVALLSTLVIFFQMPRRMMPYVESPIVAVVSMMLGLSAEEMEIYFSNTRPTATRQRSSARDGASEH